MAGQSNLLSVCSLGQPAVTIVCPDKLLTWKNSPESWRTSTTSSAAKLQLLPRIPPQHPTTSRGCSEKRPKSATLLKYYCNSPSRLTLFGCLWSDACRLLKLENKPWLLWVSNRQWGKHAKGFPFHQPIQLVGWRILFAWLLAPSTDRPIKKWHIINTSFITKTAVQILSPPVSPIKAGFKRQVSNYWLL